MNKLFYTLLFVLFISCSNNQARKVNHNSETNVQNKLQKINRFLVKKENARIKKYVDSLELDMKMSLTGLWYKVMSNGSGAKVISGDKVTIEYEIKLFDGTICYSSDSTGYKYFEVDRSNEMAGINEAVQKISKGGLIKMILPKHLGKGLMGDMKKIPPMEILFCELKVIDVEKY
jgi:FKBP-type peptidyl-prolyl cis-trans isomerase